MNIGVKSLKKSDFVLTLDQDTIIKKNAIKTSLNEYILLDKRIQSKTAIIHLNYEKIGNRLIDQLIFKLLRLDKSELKSNKNHYRFFIQLDM